MTTGPMANIPTGDRAIEIILTVLEDSDLLDHIAFTDVNVLSISCRRLFIIREDIQKQWFRAQIRNASNQSNSDDSAESKVSEFLDSLLSEAFSEGCVWPFELAVSAYPDDESIQSNLSSWMDEIVSSEGGMSSSAPHLEIAKLLLTANDKSDDPQISKEYLQECCGDAATSNELSLFNVLWEYSSSESDRNSGILDHSILEQAFSSHCGVSTLNFFLKSLDIKFCCRIEKTDDDLEILHIQPFLDAALAVMLETRRGFSGKSVVERLLALGANPYNAMISESIAYKNIKLYRAVLSKDIDRLKSILETYAKSGVLISEDSFDNPLARLLLKQFASDIKESVDYLIELEVLDPFALVLLDLGTPPNSDNGWTLQTATIAAGTVTWYLQGS
ncbi:hypothetical protein HDU76_001310 [Blyttiomyces sp. JEL0837]|nr:hypothetical protein HDU76_001310 [Blyttiomyces sp. JEL0837]